MKYVDLTHTFIDKMPVFPGDPETSLTQITSVAKEGYTDHKLTTVMHVGTHMDAPLHMIEGGKYMSEMPIERFAGQGVLLDVRGKNVIEADVLSGVVVPKGAVVLLLTGMADAYGSDTYTKTYPRITEAFAKGVVSAGAHILGMDILNPDTEESYPIHKILLSHDVCIIENMTNLESLVGADDFEILAFPMKLRADAAPVRVVARIR